jgi:Leucine-rich repeat (LRR) protein
MFGYNRKLQTLVLARNNILECKALAFHEENDFFYLDISRNRIEKLEGLTFSRLKILNIFQEQFAKSSFKSFINLKEPQILSLAVKNILDVNDETFCGLENLKYLDMSGNNTADISSSVFRNMLPQM